MERKQHLAERLVLLGGRLPAARYTGSCVGMKGSGKYRGRKLGHERNHRNGGDW